ncbi:hypothetical protein AB2N08_07140 [Massilia aurea]|uniref:hypothetical protein n=1 Tax=Massilia aurea TaxID=373040 RepID=UPI0034622ADA
MSFSVMMHHQSPLALLRVLVREMSQEGGSVPEEVHNYVYRTAVDAALLVNRESSKNHIIEPEAIELAFEIADQPDLVRVLSGMKSPQQFDKNMARRLLNEFDRFVAA